MLSKNDIPQSWSSLTWRQLCAVWQCKLRYGSNADVARAAALLALLGLEPSRENREEHDPVTGERRYMLVPDGDGQLWAVTPRELSQLARQTMKWFDYPYGDPGKEAVKDENGKVVEEAVAPVTGYVNPDWHDAMQLPEETLVVCGDRMLTGSEWQGLADAERDKILHSIPEQSSPTRSLSLFTHHFKLPSVACNNLTWQQYRSLQATASGLFEDGASEEIIIGRQAEFVAHMLVPAAPDGRTVGHTALPDRFAPRHVFLYDADRAEQTVAFWEERIKPPIPLKGEKPAERDAPFRGMGGLLYCICFQTYQTAMRYYEKVFPLLFNGSGKSDPLQDALTGETRTLNAVMKYQGYTKPEDVYAENLPIILSTLNTMAEEAKQIEQMNARINSKKH